MGSLERRGLAVRWGAQGGCAVREDGVPCWMGSRGVSGKDLQIFMTDSEPWPRPELRGRIGVSYNSTVYWSSNSTLSLSLI